MTKNDLTPEQLEQALDNMSPERIEEMKRNLEAGNTVHAPNQFDQDYTVRRKRIYKGKVSPQGTVYLVVTVKTKTRKLEAYQMIPGNMGPEFEKGAADGLRDLITKKYNV